jgi:magnesium chelatase family protein
MTNSPPGGQHPAIARARAAAVTGADGHLVDIQAEVSDGPPTFAVVGLPDTNTRETRDRVCAAVINSSQRWPTGAVTVRLLPASLPKHGSGFDLAIAVAVLAATGAVPVTDVEGCVFIAELGLDGGLRPVRGVLPALLAAASAGCTCAVVAVENSAEAVMAPGLAVIACQSLTAVAAWLRGGPLRPQPAISALATPEPAPGEPPVVSLASLAIPPQVRLARSSLM